MKERAFDYLYDPSYVVRNARDHAVNSFKSALASAQISIRPVFNTMFTDNPQLPRTQVVRYPNCRLPEHMDTSFRATLQKAAYMETKPDPLIGGADRYMFTGITKPLKRSFLPQPVKPPSSVASMESKYYRRYGNTRNCAVQTLFRESSAQTRPWQPDYVVADTCKDTPEVLYLNNMKWGPGDYYRPGELPADFHTTEIINKMRHYRKWIAYGDTKEGCKYKDYIIKQLEAYDWLFREAELDEIQSLRLELLNKLLGEKTALRTNKREQKLKSLWDRKRQELDRKVTAIHLTRDRELRKLNARYDLTLSDATKYRICRGGGSAIKNSRAESLHAPLRRYGYQAKHSHQTLYYCPQQIMHLNQKLLSKQPAWVNSCVDINKTVDGKPVPRDPNRLCDRETRWTEENLAKLHASLKAARLGVSSNRRRPRLSPREPPLPKRPDTPIVQPVPDEVEVQHQAAIVLQRMIRGRAVQTIMYRGRCRARELMDELKVVNGLLPEEKLAINKRLEIIEEEAKIRTQTQQKNETIRAVVESLNGGVLSSALDFLEKEYRRLEDEKRQRASMMIALREKAFREAMEGGRRQKEERRRREHDEMFKQVVGITSKSVDMYLQQIIDTSVECAAEAEAVTRARRTANFIDRMERNAERSTNDRREMVAELVHQFLLPEVQRESVRQMIRAEQNSNLKAIRELIFGYPDPCECRKAYCKKCEKAKRLRNLNEVPCPEPKVHVERRTDSKWRYIGLQEPAFERHYDERYPPEHEFRCLINALVSDAVNISNAHPPPPPKMKVFDRTRRPVPEPREEKECYCFISEEVEKERRKRISEVVRAAPPRVMLPSTLHKLQELRACKCVEFPACKCGVPDCGCNRFKPCDCGLPNCMCDTREPCVCGLHKCSCNTALLQKIPELEEDQDDDEC